MRDFRDRDFIQTKEGLLFCVVGQIHPYDRVISYIKYIPSESGLWKNRGKNYSRIFEKYTIPHLIKTFDYLKKNHPHYLFYSPVDKITLTAVPHKYISKHFKPELKLAQLIKSEKLDSLQNKLIKFITLLKEISNLPSQSFGVTGSLLLDIHDSSFSDIDIIIYGIKESWTLKNILTENSDSKLFMKRLEGNALKEWCIKKTKQYPLKFDEALEIYKKKWNLGIFEDKWVSIHPVKIENENQTEYGEETYIPCDQVTIKAVVEDNSESIFLPSKYRISNVDFLKGNIENGITEVLSFESLYDSIADNGDQIEVKGKLEKVVNQETKDVHYRVLVGSSKGKGKEYIKLVNPKNGFS
jgi:hypothetical protein